MKILVTGSSGFLGSHAVIHLRKVGHQITGIDITASPTTDIVCDVQEYFLTNSNSTDVLLHFAANVGGRLNIENNYLEIVANIELDRMAFKWATKNVKHIIYPSSSAVYPANYQHTPGTRLSENMIDFAQNVIGVSDHLYGWCKLTAERMLWQLHQTHDIQIHIVRPFSGYGPGQNLSYPMANLVQLIKTRPDKLEVWGSGNQTRDWVHVYDIMRTLEWCVNDTTPYQSINIGTGVATTFNELIDIIHTTVYGLPAAEVRKLAKQPTGVQYRVADTSLQRSLNVLPQITLSQGIQTLL
jgi:nucleoside-diphosphate-sugar epimerase